MVVSTLKKRRFIVLGVLICTVVLVHLEIQLAILIRSNKIDDGKLSFLEDKVDEVKRFSLGAEELSKSSRELRTVKDESVPTENIFKLLGQYEAGTGVNISDTQLFRQRLKIRNGVKELWWYLRARLKQLNQSGVSFDDISHQVKAIMSDIEKLENHPTFATWKKVTANELAQLVQKRFRYLQNPKDCKKARKLICDLSKPCGYGCLIHHIGYCFIVAYATQRTMILESNSWYFAENKGWNSVFLPLSDTCTAATTPGELWSAHNEHALEVKIPIVEMLHPRPPQMPMAIPKDLAEKLLAFHGNPFVWWAGQVFQYIIRPNKELSEFINQKRDELGFKRPIVGVQVRRTDKIGTEAAFHSIEEYMVHVEEWYEQRAITTGHHVDQKRVFLATDDHKLLAEAKEKYPNYQFVSDNKISRLAAEDSRYAINSLYGVIFDIEMLSESDYIVCTFSSQVCRLAYELMQTRHVDAAEYYYSLDDVYYFGGMQGHHVKMIYPQKSRSSNELDLEVGDTLSLAGNEKDGTSKGRVHRTGKYGEYLSYKAEDVLRIEDFPTYKEVT